MLYEHCGDNFIDYIIVNGQTAKMTLQSMSLKFIQLIDQRNLAGLRVKVIREDLWMIDIVGTTCTVGQAVIRLVLWKRLLKKETERLHVRR